MNSLDKNEIKEENNISENKITIEGEEENKQKEITEE